MFRRVRSPFEDESASWDSELGPDVFVQAVVSHRDRAYAGEPPQAELAAEFSYVRDEARIQEMRVPAELAVTFAKAEVRPRDRGLGIPPGPNAVHALGHQLNKEVKAASAAELDAAAAAVLRVLAHGYLCVLAVEGGVSPRISLDRFATADSIWATAVGNFRGDGLKHAGLGPQIIDPAEDYAADLLVSELQNAHILKKQIRVAKIRQLGRYYVNAGGFLRIGQMEWPLRAVTDQYTQALGEQFWPYSQYATS